MNVPLPALAGDQAYEQIALTIIEPFLHKIRPQLILVSAGFDAHWRDPLTALGLSTAGFHALSTTLVRLADQLCGGRILFVLEGGYDPMNVAHGAAAVFAALERRTLDAVADASSRPEPDVGPRLAAIRALHGY